MAEPRNLPHINATIYRRQDEQIKAMLAGQPNMTYSRIVREIIHFALKRGYHPGSITISDMESEAREHGIHRRR